MKKINTSYASYFARVFIFLTIMHRVHSNYDLRALETIYIMFNQPFLSKYKEWLSKYNLFVIDTDDCLVVRFYSFFNHFSHIYIFYPRLAIKSNPWYSANFCCFFFAIFVKWVIFFLIFAIPQKEILIVIFNETCTTGKRFGATMHVLKKTLKIVVFKKKIKFNFSNYS